MEQTKTNPQAPVESGRAGIIDRLKAATGVDAVKALVVEIETYAQASNKTKRRFLRVLSTKGIPASDLGLSVPLPKFLQGALE